MVASACNWKQDEAMDATKTKPFNIDKKLVYDAYKAVKANAARPEWMGSRLSSSPKILGGTSTRSGIG